MSAIATRDTFDDLDDRFDAASELPTSFAPSTETRRRRKSRARGSGASPMNPKLERLLGVSNSTAELGLRDRHSFETPIIRSANVVIALGSRSSPAPLRRRCGCGCGSASL